MHITITTRLQHIASTKNIHILYAWESGSRAWSFPSPDSDYDVRFIYIHPVDFYLSIDDKKDVMEFPVDGDLDINGCDIRKALQLFRKSNAVIFEWLQSPIVYQTQTTFAHQLQELMPEYFSPRTVMHHHLGLIHKAFSETEFGKEVKVKKYLYILRSLLSAMWVKEYKTVPPMEFKPLAQLIQHNTQLMSIIQELLALKATSGERATIGGIADLNNFIEQEFTECGMFAKSARISINNTEKINELLRQVLTQVK